MLPLGVFRGKYQEHDESCHEGRTVRAFLDSVAASDGVANLQHLILRIDAYPPLVSSYSYRIPGTVVAS